MAKAKNDNLIVYDNKLNLIPLRGMSQVENNVFFALLYKLRDKGTNEVRLDFSELKSLIDFQQNSEYIRNAIKGIAKKIAQSVVEYSDDETTKFFTLFQVLEVPNKDDFYIKAKISEPFAYLINNIQDNFTALEIAEFSNLSSKYSQTLYRLLKQFKMTGFLSMKWDRFVEIMDIPTKMAMCDIEKRVLKPAVTELQEPINLFNTKSQPFKKLSYKKTKTKGQGNKVTGIEFYFLPQNQDGKTLQRAERNLDTIANDIKRQDMLNDLKRSSSKTHPITGNPIDELKTYYGRYFRIYNDKLGVWDMLKIQNIEQAGEQLEVFLLNVDDDHRSTMKFDNFKHFKNAFEKYEG